MTKTIERRVCSASFEVRDNPDGSVGLRGYAAIFDYEAHGEVVRSSAFNRTLAQRDDVRLLVNHDGVPIARTKSGTMTLGVDERGLWFDVPHVDMGNPNVQELVSAMRRKDLDQCSFAFTTWDGGDAIVNGVRELREVMLWDVSIVTYPWYDATSAWLGADGDRAVSLRSRPLTAEAREAAYQALRIAPPGKESYGDVAMKILDAIEDMLEATTGVCPWMWLDDFGDDWAVYCVYGSGECNYFQVPYAIDASGVVTLGQPFAVEVVAEYRPVQSDPAAPGEDDSADDTRSYSIAEARALLGLDTAA